MVPFSQMVKQSLLKKKFLKLMKLKILPGQQNEVIEFIIQFHQNYSEKETVTSTYARI